MIHKILSSLKNINSMCYERSDDGLINRVGSKFPVNFYKITGTQNAVCNRGIVFDFISKAFILIEIFSITNKLETHLLFFFTHHFDQISIKMA